MIDGEYVLQSGAVYWMPELNLGMGIERGTYQGRTREWLYWYDENGERYPTPEDLVTKQQQQLEQSQQQLQTLLTRLQDRGINLDNL